MTADRKDAEAVRAELPWRCFHCDEVFTDEDAARQHFGRFEDQDPICGVTAERYREVERQLDEYRTESDAQSRFFYEMGHKHNVAVRDAEQKGYDRGLADAKAFPGTIGLFRPPSWIGRLRIFSARLAATLGAPK